MDEPADLFIIQIGQLIEFAYPILSGIPLMIIENPAHFDEIRHAYSGLGSRRDRVVAERSAGPAPSPPRLDGKREEADLGGDAMERRTEPAANAGQLAAVPQAFPTTL